jgi:uncharacterized membrane protein
MHGYWALVLRLPFQVVLLALIAWSTARNCRLEERSTKPQG